SSSLIGVLAQRLVRLLCPRCKRPYEASQEERETLGVAPGEPLTLYAAEGCKACNNIGYQGRTAIFEVVEINERMRKMIHDGVSEQELEAFAHTRSPSI